MLTQSPLPDLPEWLKVCTMLTYVVIWIVLLFPSLLPLGRPATAIIGAVACLGLRLAAGLEMAADKHISWDPIFLLFGLMLVNLYVEQTGVYKKLIDAIDSTRPPIIMLKICVVSSVLSAFLMNDTICLVMAPAVTKLCQQKRIRSMPFLLALSTSANIGSALTIVGNPQNALVAGICKLITFNGFIKHNATPVLVCAVLNCGCLYLYSSKTGQLDAPKDRLLADDRGVGEVASALEPVTEQSSSGGSHKRSGSYLPVMEPAAYKRAFGSKTGYYISVGVIVALMVAGFFLGLDVDGVAVAAGCLLMVGHAIMRLCAHRREQQVRPREAEEEPLEELAHESDTILLDIDFGLLLLFIGQFVMVGAMVDTGYPQQAFASLLGDSCSGSSIVGSWGCLTWFSTIVVVMSNLISNVPVILMLRPVLEVLPAAVQLKVWIITAWVATLAGNFIILGSAANLIVAHQAAKLGDNSFTALAHGKYGLPSTMLLLFGGMAIIQLTF
jgi:Na+/H+ antiporter NhaD/arsenite permease-like protein